MAASFPVEQADEIMLVTNGGQLIRTPVADIRAAGRNTQGVRIISTKETERVVSVEHVPENTDADATPNDGSADGDE